MVDESGFPEVREGTAARYMSAVRKAPIVLIECAGKLDDLEIAEWNEAATNVFGLTRQEAIGQSLRGTILSDAEGAAWLHLFKEDHGAPHLSTHARKDGRHIVCEWVFEPVLDELGRPARMLCFGQDVTERLEEAATLRDRETSLRAILDNLPIVMTRIAPDGTLLAQDGKGLKLTGLEPGQLVGKNVFDLFPDDQSLMQSSRLGLAGEFVHLWFEVFGTSWEGWVVPVRDEHGVVSSAITVSIDISEAKRREAELQSKLDLIEKQQKVIRDLSTPIIEVWDRVLTLPMVGVVDSMRASEVMDNLLSAIVGKGARYAILDLTGVDAVDTRTASYLLDLVRAIRLLGAEGVITGIRPNVAQTMVALGLDLSSIATRGNLRAGLKFCIQRMAATGEGTSVARSAPGSQDG